MSESTNIAVWRVSAPQFDVDSYLAEFPRPRRGATAWHVGEVRPHGRKVHDTSGFTVSIIDAASSSAALDEARRFFSVFEEAARALRARGVSSTLDIGVIVGTPSHFVRSMHFSVQELEFFGGLGVALEVTAFPYTELVDDSPPDDKACQPLDRTRQGS